MNRKKKISCWIFTGLFTLTLLSSGLYLGRKATVSWAANKPQLPPYEIVAAFPGVENKDRDLVAQKISEITKKKINATVKLITISFASWTQQINLMLAANEKLDLLWTSSYYNFSSSIAKGQFIALDSLLKKYGRNITTSLAPDVLKCCKTDGKIYSVPSMRDFANNFCFIMRKDLVDKYKIDLKKIKTINDFTAVLQTIKKNEPEMIPVATPSSQTPAQLVLQCTFDKLDNWMGVIRLKDHKLKVVDFYETPEYANLINLYRKWYEAGYLAKDVATNYEQPTSVVKAGKLFAYFYSGKPGIELQESKKCGRPMVSVAITPAVATTNSVESMMTSIPVSAKDPARSMMLLNLWYGDKGLINLYNNGIEGRHYVKKSGNIIDYPQGVSNADSGYIPCNYMVGNNFLSYIWKGDNPNIWTEMNKFNKSAIKSAAYGFTFNSESVKTEVAAVSNVISQYQLGLDTGTLEPKTLLPQFIAKLKAAGIDKIIAAKQTQLNKWAKQSK